jgi:hypothetical protein
MTLLVPKNVRPCSSVPSERRCVGNFPSTGGARGRGRAAYPDACGRHDSRRGIRAPLGVERGRSHQHLGEPGRYQNCVHRHQHAGVDGWDQAGASGAATMRTSGENRFVALLAIAPPSQGSEPPTNPERFIPAEAEARFVSQSGASEDVAAMRAARPRHSLPRSTRACPHLSQAREQTRCRPARKLRAVFS